MSPSIILRRNRNRIERWDSIFRRWEVMADAGAAVSALNNGFAVCIGEHSIVGDNVFCLARGEQG